MADTPGKVTRRRTLTTLMGATAASLAGAHRLPTPSAASGQAGPTNRPQYVFGYGSLVQTASRTRTSANARFASPVIVKGVSRGWYDRTPVASWSPTYLGAVADKNATTNGVLYPVTAADLQVTGEREVGYKLAKIDPSAVTMLDGSNAAPDADIWYYANIEKRPPTAEHPIVQSYVDICLDGCLEIEAAYPLAKSMNFAEQFIKTCTGWGTPWVNDRVYPWRPFIFVPRAEEIDALIQKILGMNLFRQIKLP